MNKLKIVFILMFLPILMSCKSQYNIKKDRELLRDYFLCVCIMEGFRNLGIEEYDISQGVYFDISRYSPEAHAEIKNYAKEFVDSIQPSMIADHNNKKGLIIQSIDKYKSKELKKRIKSMDKYLNYK